MTVLETAAVAPSTQRMYAKYLKEFLDWKKHRVVPGNIDGELVDFLDLMFADGRPAGDGEKVVAAVVAAQAGLDRKTLTRTLRALRGFRKVSPARSRLPIPEEVAAGITAILMSLQQQQMAVFVMTLFYSYLRPGEARKMLAKDLVLPVKGARKCFQFAAIQVAPEERLELSKTQTFDDTVLLNGAAAAVAPTLLAIRATRKLEEPLFQLPPDGGVGLWKQAIATLQLPPLVLYQLRHGGASADLLEGRRSGSEIMARGRWRAAGSMRRYAKSGRVQQLLGSLSPATRQFCEESLAKLSSVLAGTIDPKTFRGFPREAR